MSSSEKKNTFYGGAAILAIGSIIVKLIGALYKIPLGNILSNEAYTNFNTAYNVYNLFLTISTAGLPVALSKTISEADTLGRRNQIQRVFRVALTTFAVLGLLSFIAMSFFGAPLAVLMGDDSAVYCIRALSPSVLCVCIMSAFRGYYQGHSNMVPTAVSQIIEATCKLVIGLALAFLVLRTFTGGDAYKQRMAAAGAIFGVSVGSIIALIYMVTRYVRSRRRESAQPSHDKPDAAGDIFTRLLKLAVPITLGSAAISIVTIIDTKVVLSLLRKMYENLPELISAEALAQVNEPGGVAAELFMAQGLKGIYDKCMAIYNLPSQLMVAITASVIPAVSACLAKRDKLAASRTSESALHIGVILAFPMGIGLYALAGPIVELLFPGKMNLDIAAPIMATLGIATIFVCIMLICNSILQAHGLVNLPVITVIIGGIIKIVVNYILVGNYDINIKGAPVGTLCCFAAVAVLDLIIIKRVIPLPPRYTKVFVKPLIAAALMGAAAWASHGLLVNFLGLGNRLATIGAILVAVVVYVVLVLALRVISAEDLALMPKGDKIAKFLHIK
ncbi:MAG: oligosaccharide flippase family protein [Oscillospiraceae bacterium]